MSQADGKKGSGPREPDELRRRAETRLAEQGVRPELPEEAGARVALFHELSVHQIELELQNDELQRARLEMETSQARYRDLYERAPVAYLTLDQGGRIVDANSMALALLGALLPAVTGQLLTRWIVPEDQDTFYLHRQALTGVGASHSCELRLVRADETRRSVRIDSTRVGDSAGEQSMLRLGLTDVTDARALQVALAQAETMASIGEIAAGVAHEINNPLSYVLANLHDVINALERSETSEPVGGGTTLELAKSALHGVERIHEVARGLGDLAGAGRAEPSSVDLAVVLERAIQLVANETRHRATVVKELGDTPKIWGSAGELTQVFLNLLLNAAQAIQEGAFSKNRIMLRTWSHEAQVYCEVSDTGSGISAEDLEKIFDPLFTTGSVLRRSGLGLGISRRIVRDLGGDIKVTSVLGEGSRFLVCLPKAAAETQPVRRAPSAAPAACERGRVLVVDDEEGLRRIFERVLRVTHDVVAVGSGREAQELLARDPSFDLVLCDLMMPDVSGADLHAWLQVAQPRLAANVVFMTGGVFTERTTEYLSRVPNHVIQKPFAREALLELVNSLVAAARR